MATVFLNGRFVRGDGARVSAFDAGFQHGVGLFETMPGRVIDGRAEVVGLEEHLDRLIDSARTLGLSDSLRKHALAEAVGVAAERAYSDEGIERSRIRLTITGGDLNLLPTGRAGGGGEEADDGRRTNGAGGHDPTVLIVVQPATVYPEEMFERGVPVVIADLRVNPLDPFSGHKTLNYWPRLRELQRAAAARAGEAIVFQVTNHLAGGCVSNVFLVKDGRLLTPIARGEEEAVGGKGALPSPVLPGITRGRALRLAEDRGIECARRMLAIDDLLGADEVFLTNSSWGVLPVVRVEREMIGSGSVGDVTAQMRREWGG